MSDSTSIPPPSNKSIQVLVESIVHKLENSQVLNGGFDKMMITVDHIKENQTKTDGKVDRLTDGLYNPETGLYTRVKTIETSIRELSQRHSDHLISDQRNMSEINVSLKQLTKKDEVLLRKAETTSKLKKIAGEDLEKLEATLKARSTWIKTWHKVGLVIGGVFLTGIGKLMWDWLVHHH